VLLSQLPDVIAKCEVELTDLKSRKVNEEEEINALILTQDSLQTEINNLFNEVSHLQESVAKQIQIEKQLRKECANLGCLLDDHKARADDLLFWYGRLDNSMRSLQFEVAQKDSMIDSIGTQLAVQTDFIQRYITEEAVFQPRYTKTMAE
jgi:chromosome segregation ATPase